MLTPEGEYVHDPLEPQLTHDQVALIYSLHHPQERPMTRATAEWICRQAIKKLRASEELERLFQEVVG